MCAPDGCVQGAPLHRTQPSQSSFTATVVVRRADLLAAEQEGVGTMTPDDVGADGTMEDAH